MTKLLAMLVAVAAVTPAAASAQEPVASAVAYEVNEALRFMKPRQREGGRTRAEVARRLARASLLGKEVRPSSPTHPVFREGQFIQADAMSSVDLSTGKGPITGLMQLLVDVDPTRESLDTLVIETVARIRGELDLSTAMQGYANLTGTWSTAGKKTVRSGGTMRGLFLIPFAMDDRYYYVDLGAAGPGTLCASPEGLCPLSDDEFALGIPLTKLVVTFFE